MPSTRGEFFEGVAASHPSGYETEGFFRRTSGGNLDLPHLWGLRMRSFPTGGAVFEHRAQERFFR